MFSLLHPCFPGAGPSLSSWPPAGYYSEGRWVAEGHAGYRGVAGATHRTLTTYLNALIGHGLEIDAIDEPAPSGMTLPMFLVVRSIRR